MAETAPLAPAIELPAGELAVAPPSRPVLQVRRWEILLVLALGALLYLPRLGSTNLWDPWETHYGEVARRMLQDHDWIHTKWQNESFRSKPVLTFWLMALGMKAFGVAEDGGYSGEMVSNPWVEWAIRTPFALFGIGGLVLLFYALARLYSRRAAWLATIILGTSPYYFFVSRQAITDMPSCAMLIAGVALFALAVFDEDQALKGPYASKKGFWLYQGLVALCFQGFGILCLLSGNSSILVVGVATMVTHLGLQLFCDWRAARKSGGSLADGRRARIAAFAGLHAFHLFMVFLLLICVVQFGYFVFHTTQNPLRFSPTSSMPGPLVFLPFMVALVGVVTWLGEGTRKRSQVFMYWFYLLAGLALLAKGPVMPFLAGLTILVYLLLSGEWHLLRKLEIVKGVLIAVLVGIPWHFAMFLKDGVPYINEYVGQHILNRALKGVFGDRGTFDYFMSQMSVGMWPWAAFVPAALVPLALSPRARTREEKLRMLFGMWAILAFFFFCFIETKFHHYILPAVPALAVVVAFYFDDLLANRVRFAALGLLVALGCFIVMSLDLSELRIVNLAIFRYDRPWPSGPPWNISYTTELTVFAVAMGAFLALLVLSGPRLTRIIPRLREIATVGMLGTALAFTVFVVQILMASAAPHWGQKHLHQTYYAQRQIHGVDLIYDGLGEVARDWQSGSLSVRSVIPRTMHQGDPMTVHLEAAGEALDLAGAVGKIDHEGDAFVIDLDAGSRQKLQPLLERARTSHDPPRQRTLSIDADRLLAWQLNWRGENFYSGGEIWQAKFPDAQTVFIKTDNVEFKKYITDPERTGKGRRFFVITEKGRLAGFPQSAGTPTARKTFQVEDDSSNKFGLGSFQLDGPPREAPKPVIEYLQ